MNLQINTNPITPTSPFSGSGIPTAENSKPLFAGANNKSYGNLGLQVGATPTVQVSGPVTGVNTTVPNPLFSTPVNPSPSASDIPKTNAIELSNDTSNVHNSLRATTDAAMSTPPTPPPAYDNATGFLTAYGKSQGMKPVQPNDPSGGANSSSLVNNYLKGSTNPSTIDNGNLIPDTSKNANNSILSQYQGLNNQLGNETQTRNDLNNQLGVDQKGQNYIDAFNQYNSKKVSYDQQIEKLYNQPGITREQADQQVKEISRQNNADLANLAVVTQAAQGNYTTALDIVQRKMDTQFQPVQQQIDNLKSIVQSPNSDLTASQEAKINANVFALQNNLTNTKNALSNGSQTLIQNGLYTAEIGKQLDAAQTPEQVNSIVSQAMTGAGFADPNATSNGTGVSNLSSQTQSYVTSTQGGAKYVSQDKLSNLNAYQQQQAGRELAAAGIPVLTTEQTQKIQNIDVTQQNISALSDVISGKDITTGAQGSPLLGNGVSGRVGSAITNTIGKITQSNPNIAAFDNYRLTAINTLQSLGAGSGGSRITAGEIATAVSNLPTLTDNMQTAQAKLSIVNGFLTKWTNELIPQNASSGSTGNGLYDW